MSEAGRVHTDRDGFAVVVIDVDGMSLAAGAMVGGIELVTVVVRERVQPQGDVPMSGALDDADATERVVDRYAEALRELAGR